MGSLEFAVTQLQMPLIVVMGHEACAIRAAVPVARGQAAYGGNVSKVLHWLLPAVLYDRCAHTFMSTNSIAATYCYWL